MREIESGGVFDMSKLDAEAQSQLKAFRAGHAFEAKKLSAMLEGKTQAEFDAIARDAEWTVLWEPRDRCVVAFHAGDASFALKRAAGRLRKRRGETRLEYADPEACVTLDDTAVIAGLQAQLDRDQRLPLATIVDALGMTDALAWPGVLDHGAWHYSRPARRLWSTTRIAAEQRYDILLPQPLIDAWRATS